MTALLPPNSTIAVVGAGIIGTSAAFALCNRGFAVTLYDRAEPGSTGPSFGNAGHIAGQGIFPLASPGIALKGIGMLMRSEGALKIPPAYMGQITPWLWAFWRNSFGPGQDASIKALTQLATGTLDETETLWTRAGIARLLTRQPCLSLYDSEASYQLDHPSWEQLAAAGFSSTSVDSAAIRELEPNLAPIFPRGVLSHDYGYVTDPFDVVTAMFDAARRIGVGFEQLPVTALRASDDSATLIVGGNERRYDAVLVAAGAWSPPLARSLGETLPVEAERGYNLSFGSLTGTLKRPLLLADRGIAITPLATGLRFGGWTELGGTSLPANPTYWKTIRGIAAQVIPSTSSVEAREWMGHRPSTPDSVPAISRSTKSPRVFYAVGHGHYGLSNSAKTARFITEIIADGADGRYRGFAMSRWN
jgi:D-amino-acid dehydrogenase